MCSTIIKGTYTVPEVADVLGIGRSLAYELARQGKIPVIQLGRRLLVPIDRFNQWLLGGGV